MTTSARWARQYGIGPRAFDNMQRGALLFATVAFLGAAGDLLTKWWAVERLPKLGLVALTERLGLWLVYNQGTAGGYAVGEHTMVFNIVAMSTVLLIVTAFSVMLSGIDRWSPIAFGMIAGGGGGNLVSVIGGPSGVPDFLAWQRTSGSVMVFNVADVVLWVGCAMLIPVGIRLATRLRGPSSDVRVLLAS
jgi:signal peptidase II